MDVLILAAGLGTRLRPLTLTTPKPMLSLGKETILGRQLRQLCDVPKIDQININISYKAESIVDYVHSNFSRFLGRITFFWEESPLGTDKSVLNVLRHSNHCLLVLHGDLYLESNGLNRLIKEISEESLSHIAIHQRVGKGASSIVNFQSDNLVTSFFEKPKNEQVNPDSMIFSNSGVYCFQKSDIEHYDSVGNIPITKGLIPHLIEQNKLKVAKWNGARISIDNVESLKLAQRTALD